jgi:hypothetical protein
MGGTSTIRLPMEVTDVVDVPGNSLNKEGKSYA